MTKNEFIKKLKNSLQGLPANEIKDVISDYEEHFAAGKEEGRSEEELVGSLGDPEQIARQTKASYQIKKAENNVSASNIIRAVLATAGLGFINLIFVLGPFFGLVGMMFGLLFGGIALVSCGVVGFLVSIIALVSPHAFGPGIVFGTYPEAAVFFSISMSAFGILFLIGWGYLAKWFYILTVRYLKFNARIITGEKE